MMAVITTSAVRTAAPAAKTVWDLFRVRGVFNQVLGDFHEHLMIFKEGQELKAELCAARNEIVPGTNEAVAIRAMWSLTNELVVRAGDLAAKRLQLVRGFWTGTKAREFEHNWPGSEELLAKYAQLWAPAPGDDHVVIGSDGTLRRLMQKTALEMFAIVADNRSWAPYGRCKCGKAIRPDRRGYLHPECGVCYRNGKAANGSVISIEIQTGMSEADLAEIGVTVTPADKSEDGNHKSRRDRQPRGDTRRRYYNDEE